MGQFAHNAAIPVEPEFRMQRLILGLVVFLGGHSISVVAPAWRDRMAARLGANAWRGLYSVFAALGLYLLVTGFAAARVVPVVLYVPPAWLHWLAVALMVPVMPMLFAAYLPGRIRSTLRHPMLVAVKTWALAHLLANGMLADVLLFGGILAWAVAVRISLKRRPARPLPAAPAGRYNDLIAVVAGLTVYFALLHGLHARLFGVAPLP
jgi:uncharacterized membrane protein